MSFDLPVKPRQKPRESLYLKGVRKTSAIWFRAEAARLGYNLNEFFDLIVDKTKMEQRKNLTTEGE